MDEKMYPLRMFIDLETTGLNSRRHIPTEISVILRGKDGVDVNFSTLIRWPLSELGVALGKADPMNLPRLLELIRKTADSRGAYPMLTPSQIVLELRKMLNGYADGQITPVGFNVEKLDLPFMEMHGLLTRDELHHRSIQLGQLWMRPSDLKMPDTLETVRRALAVEVDAKVFTEKMLADKIFLSQFLKRREANDDVNTHSSWEDVRAARAVYGIWEAQYE